MRSVHGTCGEHGVAIDARLGEGLPFVAIAGVGLVARSVDKPEFIASRCIQHRLDDGALESTGREWSAIAADGNYNLVGSYIPAVRRCRARACLS